MTRLLAHPEKWNAKAMEQRERPRSAFPVLAVAGGLLQALLTLQFAFPAYVEHGDWRSWLACGIACGVGAICALELAGAGQASSPD
jgi:hypothetical protein